MYTKLSMFRSSPPVVFSNNDTAKIQSKSRGEQTRRSAIPTKPLCNFTEITPMHVYAPENPHDTRKTPLPRRAHLGDCSCMSK